VKLDHFGRGDGVEKKEKSTIPFSQEHIDNQINAINRMMSYRNFSLVNSVYNLSSEIYRPRRVNRVTLRRALSDPYNNRNIEILQQASSVLKCTNGIYRRVLNYQANMHTNDFLIYPLDAWKFKDSESMQNAYIEAAKFIEKFNLKDNAVWIKERVLEQGELFIYKIEDKNGVILQEIPNHFCKITSVEDNVCRYAINLKKINKKNIGSLPKEIQILYDKFTKGELINLIDNSYYELGNNAYAFNLDRFAPKGIPFYCTIFDDLMELEDKKDLKSQNDVIESIRLIHQKFPLADDGSSLIDFNLVETYHNSTKSTLPAGTAVTTNPFELKTLSLSDNNSKLSTTILSAKDMVFDSAGINAELFNGNRNNSEAIAMGIIGDTLVAKPLNNMICNWINNEFKKQRFGNTTWAVRMIGTTEFNKENMISRCRENLAYGGSRLEFLACNGYTPLEGLSVLKMEGLLNLEELFVPQATSHTQSSGRTSKSDGGSGDEDVTTPLAQN
jgi:hypothetical protein